jgi:hypothetical protein
MVPRPVQAIQVKCPNCAAVLNAAAGAESVTCEYCGTGSTIQRRTRMFQLPLRVEPPPHRVHVARQVVRPVRLFAALFSTLFPLAMLAGIGWFVKRQVEAATGRPVSQLLRQAAGAATGGSSRGDEEDWSWQGSGAPLLRDVDGDGALDAIGRVRTVRSGDQIAIAAFSGASGARLWKTASLGTYSATYQGRAILAGELVLFADPGGVLSAYRLAPRRRAGEKAWTAALAERVSGTCRLGESHVALQLADQRWADVSLRDGSVSKAKAPRRCERLPDDDDATGDVAVTTSDPGTRWKLDGMQVMKYLRLAHGPEVALGMRAPGTSVPMVARVDGGKARWKVEVPASSPLQAAGHLVELAALTEDLVCVAYQPNGTDPPHLGCFELAGGTRRWDSEVAKGTTIVMRGLIAGGRRLFLSSWGHLQAYDLATGKRLYTVGDL